MLSKAMPLVFSAMLLHASLIAQTQPHPQTLAAAPRTAKPTVKYGSNPTAGNTFTHDGVKLYFEVYGRGSRSCSCTVTVSVSPP
jgi:hypothetical protein